MAKRGAQEGQRGGRTRVQKLKTQGIPNGLSIPAEYDHEVAISVLPGL